MASQSHREARDKGLAKTAVPSLTAAYRQCVSGTDHHRTDINTHGQVVTTLDICSQERAINLRERRRGSKMRPVGKENIPRALGLGTGYLGYLHRRHETKIK